MFWNDYWCKGLSFTQHRSEAYEKYLAIMRKRKEEQAAWKLEDRERGKK